MIPVSKNIFEIIRKIKFIFLFLLFFYIFFDTHFLIQGKDKMNNVYYIKNNFLWFNFKTVDKKSI